MVWQEHEKTGDTGPENGDRPTRRPQRRSGRWLHGGVLAACYLALTIAHLWQPGRGDQSAVYDTVSWITFMVRTFTPHLGVLLAVRLAWTVRRRRRGMALLMTPLVLFCNRQTTRDLWPNSPPAVAGTSWRMMTVNLRRGNHDNAQRILRQIHAFRPDILALLEYSNPWHQRLYPSLAKMYAHHACKTRDRDSFGAAIYSKFPFVGDVNLSVRLADHDACQIRAVLDIEGRHVVSYVVHLMPPSNRSKLRLQEAQMVGLLEHLRAESRPVLLCGDFNFTVDSFYHNELTELSLQDAHRLGGWGWATTWPALPGLAWIPGVRIDHLYLSKELTCVRIQTGRPFGSDHRPLTAKIGFRNPPSPSSTEGPR